MNVLTWTCMFCGHTNRLTSLRMVCAECSRMYVLTMAPESLVLVEPASLDEMGTRHSRTSCSQCARRRRAV